MVKIASYVFFDIETTGLPHQEKNKTKITEISFVAALREDIEKATSGSQPYVSKFTQLINPEKDIHPEVTKLTGLSNNMVENAPIFKDTVSTIVTFLNSLPKPTCLVAHNGNRFDYKILLAEFLDAGEYLPSDLLCVDSLSGFRKIHKENINKSDSSINKKFYRGDSFGSEDWPDLDISKEDLNEIDELCASFSDKIPVYDVIKEESVLNFTLPSLYKRLLKKEPMNAHRAENDCLMLLECVVASKNFLSWADKFYKKIHDIEPLNRKRYH